jgi:hypothetical protein
MDEVELRAQTNTSLSSNVNQTQYIRQLKRVLKEVDATLAVLEELLIMDEL